MNYLVPFSCLSPPDDTKQILLEGGVRTVDCRPGLTADEKPTEMVRASLPASKELKFYSQIFRLRSRQQRSQPAKCQTRSIESNHARSSSATPPSYPSNSEFNVSDRSRVLLVLPASIAPAASASPAAAPAVAPASPSSSPAAVAPAPAAASAPSPPAVPVVSIRTKLTVAHVGRLFLAEGLANQQRHYRDQQYFHAHF